MNQNDSKGYNPTLSAGFIMFRKICQVGLARQHYSKQDIERLTHIQLEENYPPIRLSALLCSQINELSNDPTCCLKLGLSAHPLDYGNIGHLAQQCQNLGEALHLIFHYLNAFMGGIHYELSPDEDNELLNIDIKIDDQLEETDYTALLEFRTAILLRMSHYLTGDIYGIEKLFLGVSFRHSPNAPLDKYAKLLPISTQFDFNVNRLTLFKSAIFRPIPQSDEYLKNIFLKKIQKSYLDLLDGRPLQEKIKLYIRDHIHHDRVFLPDMATHLNASVSTIKRHLKLENTSYQKIYDEARIEIAKELLINSEITIKDISDRIQFSRASAFCRIFKTKIGCTAQEYRSLYR